MPSRAMFAAFLRTPVTSCVTSFVFSRASLPASVISCAACVGPSLAFYYMVDIMTVLYLPDSDDMRYEAAKWAIVLASISVIMVLLFFLPAPLLPLVDHLVLVQAPEF